MALRPNRPQSSDDQKAERKAAQEDVFLREVDDALRQDEMLGVFSRYGWPIGLVVGLGLAIFAGILWWNNHQAAQAGERGEQMTLALDDLDSEQDRSGKQAVADAEPGCDAGPKAAAQMLRAGIALQQGKRDEALKLFKEVSADTSAPQPYRDLATIREVAANFDALPPQQVIDRLKALAVPGNPWFGSAGELVGMAYLKQNNTALAGPLFAAIARDKDTPESLRNRVRQLAGLLGVDAIDDTAKAAGVAQP